MHFTVCVNVLHQQYMNSWHLFHKRSPKKIKKYALQVFLNWLTSSKIKFGFIQIKVRTVTSVWLWGGGGLPLFNQIRGTICVTWSCGVHPVTSASGCWQTWLDATSVTQIAAAKNLCWLQQLTLCHINLLTWAVFHSTTKPIVATYCLFQTLEW